MVVVTYSGWGAEAVERDDRGAPPGGARRDPGHHGGAGVRAWAAGGNDGADRRADRHRTRHAVQILPRHRHDPAYLAPPSDHRAPPPTHRRPRPRGRTRLAAG